MLVCAGPATPPDNPADDHRGDCWDHVPIDSGIRLILATSRRWSARSRNGSATNTRLTGERLRKRIAEKNRRGALEAEDASDGREITADHTRIAHKARKKGTGSRPWMNYPHHEFRLRAGCLSPFSVRNTSVIRCSRSRLDHSRVDHHVSRSTKLRHHHNLRTPDDRVSSPTDAGHGFPTARQPLARARARWPILGCSGSMSTGKPWALRVSVVVGPIEATITVLARAIRRSAS
jgi:hypothetical protein